MYSLSDLQNLSQVTSTQQRFATDNQRSIGSRDISLHGISLCFGSLSILKDAQIKLAWGTKYGLIGRYVLRAQDCCKRMHVGQILFMPSLQSSCYCIQSIPLEETGLEKQRFYAAWPTI